MIPEAYWKLLRNWWWLVAAFFVLGAGGAYYLAVSSVIFESRGVLEVFYAQNPDGSISFNEFDRRIESNKMAAEMNGTWVSQRLIPALIVQDVPFGDPSTLSLSIDAASRLESNVGPAILMIKVRHADPNIVRVITTVATEEFLLYLLERQDQLFRLRRAQTQTQVVRLEEELRGILEIKRQALQDEATQVNIATLQLLNANQQLLDQLPTVFDEFESRLAAQPSLFLEQQALDEILGDLETSVAALSASWKSDLGPAVRTLYAAESVPDYQLASVAEDPVRFEYEKALRLQTTLTSNLPANGEGMSPVNIIVKSTSPELVRAFGLRKRFVLIAGGVAGLAVGWIFANLAEYIFSARIGRRRDKLNLKKLEAAVVTETHAKEAATGLAEGEALGTAPEQGGAQAPREASEKPAKERRKKKK